MRKARSASSPLAHRFEAGGQLSGGWRPGEASRPCCARKDDVGIKQIPHDQEENAGGGSQGDDKDMDSPLDLAMERVGDSSVPPCR